MYLFDLAMKTTLQAIGHFDTTEIAFEVASVILLASLAIWGGFVLRPHLSFLKAMRAATNLVAVTARNGKLTSDDKLAVLNKGLKGNAVVWEAWIPYVKSLRNDPSRKGERVNPIDPYAWFSVDRLPGRGYEKWATTMAGVSLTVGLLFTFIGLTAALLKVGEAGADTAQLRLAISDILRISSAKFITSMAGIVAYIGWTLVARAHMSSQSKLATKFASAIQTLSAPVTPEAVLMDQLAQAEEQTRLMRTQADDMAVAFDMKIGQRFDALPAAVSAVLQPALENSMRPVVAAIQDMGTTIGAGNQAAVGGMLKDLMSGVHDATGRDMSVLAESMRNAAAELTAAKSGIGSGGAEFGEMLARASSDMNAASARMADAMESRIGDLDNRMKSIDDVLSSGASRIDAMGTGMSDRLAEGLRHAMESIASASTAGADVARQHAQAGLAPVLSELTSLMSEMKKSADESRGALVDGGQSAARHLAEALANVGKELSSASTQASTELAGAFQSSTTRMLAAVEESVSGYRVATEALSARLAVVERGFGDLNAAVQRNVGHLETVGTSLTAAGRDFGAASDQLREATLPVLSTLETVSNAATGAREALQLVQETGGAMRDAASAMADASEAAISAFASYEKRFDGVDASLGQTVATLRDGVIELGTRVSEVVQSYDEHLAKAVNSLSGGVNELVEAVDGIGARVTAAAVAA